MKACCPAVNAPPLVPVPNGMAAVAVSVPRTLVAKSDAPPLTTEVADGLGAVKL